MHSTQRHAHAHAHAGRRHRAAGWAAGAALLVAALVALNPRMVNAGA
jgi:hypothetical protein